jgi:hypothetical protein
MTNMFKNVRKLFKKSPEIPRNDYWYEVILHKRGSAMLGNAHLMPMPFMANTEIFVTNVNSDECDIFLCEMASSESTAILKATERTMRYLESPEGQLILESGLDRFTARKIKQHWNKPATKRDIDDVRNDIISLKEYLEKKNEK